MALGQLQVNVDWSRGHSARLVVENSVGAAISSFLPPLKGALRADRVSSWGPTQFVGVIWRRSSSTELDEFVSFKRER